MMSCLGHKEWRFVLYAVPVGNVVAARGWVWMYVLFYSRFRIFVTWPLTRELFVQNEPTQTHDLRSSPLHLSRGLYIPQRPLLRILDVHLARELPRWGSARAV